MQLILYTLLIIRHRSHKMSGNPDRSRGGVNINTNINNLSSIYLLHVVLISLTHVPIIYKNHISIYNNVLLLYNLFT